VPKVERHFFVCANERPAMGKPSCGARGSAALLTALQEGMGAHPELWGVDELHLEIETYTWDVLPGPARGTGELADGLEREYLHVIARLEAAGWKRSSAPFR